MVIAPVVRKKTKATIKRSFRIELVGETYARKKGVVDRMLQVCAAIRMRRTKPDRANSDRTTRVNRSADLESGQRGLLGTQLTGADVQLSFVGELAAARLDCSAYPNMIAWVKRFQGRPAYQAALERGGPYAFAL